MRHSGWELLAEQRCLQYRDPRVSCLPCALILVNGVKGMNQLILILASKICQRNHTQPVYVSPLATKGAWGHLLTARSLWC